MSYSHKDAHWLKRLQVHVKPLLRDVEVEWWDDTMIEAGADWRGEIESALASARVAVLLISADFLASDFIANDELPELLKAAEEDGVAVIPLILSPSRFTKLPSLARFQAINPPEQPLVGLKRARQEEFLVKAVEAIEQALAAAPQASRRSHDGLATEFSSAPANSMRDQQPASGPMASMSADTAPLPEPHGAPPWRQDDYLERPEDLEKVRGALLKDGRRMVGITGVPDPDNGVVPVGIGKGTLATAVAHDDQVRAAFPAGIFWLELGSDDVTRAQEELAALLKLDGFTTSTKPQRKELLEGALASRGRCLLILNDVLSKTAAYGLDLGGAREGHPRHDGRSRSSGRARGGSRGPRCPSSRRRRRPPAPGVRTHRGGVGEGHLYAG